MGMLHSSSGKRHFELYHEPTNYKIPKGVMKAILIREDQLRASAEYQAKYNEDDDLSHFREVTRELQLQALREVGIVDAELLDALVVLNNARFDYKDDPEMNQLTVYQRLDRSRQGTLKNESKLPNVPLIDEEGKSVMFADIEAESAAQGKALAIIAGSVN